MLRLKRPTWGKPAVAALLGVAVLGLAVLDYSTSPAEHRGIHLGPLFVPLLPGQGQGPVAAGHTPKPGSNLPANTGPPPTNRGMKIFAYGVTTGIAAQLKSSSADGYSWLFKWSDVEPANGQFNWAKVDQALASSRSAGKLTMLRVTSGIYTPSWVYAAGAKQVLIPGTEFRTNGPANYCGGTPLVSCFIPMPAPWDGVYLQKWGAFIAAFGARYNGAAGLYSVQMSGGGFIGEMSLPWNQVTDPNGARSRATWTAHLPPGASLNGALETTWETIIRDYRAAFSRTPTNLDVGAVIGDQTVMTTLTTSYLPSHYPRVVYVQANGLQASIASFPNNSVRSGVRASMASTTVGYQMNGGGATFNQNMATAFQVALCDHASYLEIYVSDIRNPVLAPLFQLLHTGARLANVAC